MVAVRTRLQRLLLWRVWERLLEIEFIDRSVALAGKAFVSFFPLVIVVAAFVPEGVRSSLIAAVTARLGMRGEALTLAQQAFASSDQVRKATGLLGLVLTIFFASSFTTALQRIYLRAWRRPHHRGVAVYWRGLVCVLLVLAGTAMLGGLSRALHGAFGVGLLAVVGLLGTSALWWFTAWFLLLGDVRARALIPTGVITSLATLVFAASATIWMPEMVTSNQAQFGFFGIALALVSWFSGASVCVLIGACAGSVFAEDPGRIGELIRGSGQATLIAGAGPSLAPPARELDLRNAFDADDDT